MRKRTVLVTFALAVSLIILTQLATTHVSANGITANVDIDPDSLLLTEDGNGEWITAYIGPLPDDYNVSNIDVSSVTLDVMGYHVYVLRYDIQENKLMVKFDRAMVISLLWSMVEHMSPHVKEKVTLEVAGILYDGTTFRGSDTIRVFFTQP